ncbi:MAG: hypothetical protein M1839_008138 [Geoglossum umbratile]|nr:MAG: hypothetical protein M1839_008138 [Geoglossum umbratile]
MTTQRPETECYTTYIANLLLTRNKVGGQDVSAQSLRILDLCTGTGCISLLLYSLLSQAFRHISIHGVDISALAINLARKNLRLNVAKNNLPSSALDQVQFFQADVLRPGFVGSSVWKDGDLPDHKAEYNILISNPPYISPEEFTKSTSRSVRNWEPRSALVPCAENGMLDCKRGDEFYPGLLAAAVQARCQFVALEVADLEQGKRVVSMVQGSGKWKGVEIWRDWVDPRNPTESFVKVDNGGRVTVRGEGNGRVVVCWSVEGEVISTRRALE